MEKQLINNGCMTPFFSIIIPVYNVAPYLRECLDSVLAQTFTDWEAICVDDGSTDGSGAILDEYAARDPRFRVIHQTNAGVSAARNRALDVAKGEWVWFVDSDDSIKPHALETFAKIENKADITYFGMEQWCQTGIKVINSCECVDCTVLTEDSFSCVSRLFDNECRIDMLGWACNKFISRELIWRGKIRFMSGINFVEDELFAMDVFNHAKSFGYIDSALYKYRWIDVGLSKTMKTAECYEELGDEFARNAFENKWTYLQDFAASRAVQWYCDAICATGGSIKSAFKLVKFIRAYKLAFPRLKYCVIGCRKAEILNKLAKFPISISTTVLWLMFKVHKKL